MSYVATVTIEREARGEGDRPLLIVAGSGSFNTVAQSADEAIEKALERALKVVRAGLEARK